MSGRYRGGRGSLGCWDGVGGACRVGPGYSAWPVWIVRVIMLVFGQAAGGGCDGRDYRGRVGVGLAGSTGHGG